MKHRGFTLVEILMAVLLGTVVVLITLSATKQAALIMERMSSRYLAWERGQNALSIIEPRALHAGFGLTYERVGDVFSRSFGKNNLNSPLPARWTDGRGPLQILTGPTLRLAQEDGGVFRGHGVAILYAIPSELRAVTEDDEPIHLNEGESAKIRLIPQGALAGIGTRLPAAAPNDLRLWVTFPLMRLPVHASYLAGSAGGLTIRMAEGSGRSATLYPYDEMHYLRADRFYVQHQTMYSQELRTAWTNEETRLEGVLEMWFEWTPSKKLLEAWILTTGGHSSRRTAKPKDWPSEAPWRDSFELHDVVVTKGSWYLKNM